MNEAKATRYQRRRRRGAVWAWLSAFGMLSVIALTPIARSLEAWAVGVSTSESSFATSTLALVLFTLVIVALWELALLPATLHVALGVDRAYLSTQPSRWSALGGELQAAIVSAPFALFAALAVQVSVAVTRDWWWLVSALLMTTGLVVIMIAGPAALAVIGTVRPLARKSLASALADVIAQTRVPVAGVYEWVVGPGVRASALVAGIGRMRRVLLATELARTWSDDELSVVVAHELAHHAHHDLLRSAGLNAAVLAAGLWAADVVLAGVSPHLGVTDLGTLAALPAVALVAGLCWLGLTPLRRAQSRRHERRADLFALECTGHADAFGAAVRRLGAERLSEDRPSRLTRWLFHRHPTVAERLAVAEAFRSRRP